MSYINRAYVIYDRNHDTWAYNRIKRCNLLQTCNFNFSALNIIYQMWIKTENEQYIRSKLKKEFQHADQVIVFIGEKTKNLNTYMKCEIEVALELDIPVIGVNLNGKRNIDYFLCPPIMRNKYIIFIPFNMKIIQCALEHFPSEYERRNFQNNGPRFYNDLVYQHLGVQYE